MKRLGLILTLLLSLARPALAQDATVSASLSSAACPGTGCVTLNLANFGTAAIGAVSSAFDGQAIYEATIDGTTWFTVPAWAPAQAAATTTTSGSTNVLAPVAGYRGIRVRVFSYVSGTLDVTIRASSPAQIVTNLKPPANPTPVSLPVGVTAGGSYTPPGLGVGPGVRVDGGAGIVAIFLSDTGSFIGTILVTGDVNGSHQIIQAMNVTDGTGPTSVLAFNKTYMVPAGGLQFVELYVSAYTSGSFDYEIGSGPGSINLPIGNQTVVQPTGSNLHITCDAGCGGAASFLDNAAFTFGTTAVNTAGYVVDDVAPNTVTENAAGAPRMTPARIAYSDLSKSASNTNSFKVDFGGAAQPISGTVTTSPPANASTNVAQVAGVTPSLNTGVRDAGTRRVTIATNDVVPVTGTFFQATQPVSGTVTTTPPANASTNVTQLAGTATSVNSGVKDAGTLRVVLATDQPQLTNKLLVTPDSVALPANQSTNVNQFGGSAVVTGVGASGSGIPRVTPAMDPITSNAPAAATVGVASAQALAANASRKAAFFVNTSGNTISCAIGATAVLNSGITLQAGAVWNMVPPFVKTGAVNCIASAVASNLSIQEDQ